MEAEQALRQLGGVATTADLYRLTTRRQVRTALDHRRVRRATRGRYALAEVGRQREVAARHTAVLSHLSAAQHHGWPGKDPPRRPWITVPRNRKVAREVQATAHVTFADLEPHAVRDGVTAPLRTVVDCARRLPFAEALAVADSALRARDVTADDLREAAGRVRGPGATRARRVAAHGDARAANPFESAIRAIAIDVPGLHLTPQHPVFARTATFHPDLVDERLRLVVEAESWGFHSDAQTHDRDCVRFNAMTVAGWRVLRFTWSHVMHSPAYVEAVLTEAVGLDTRRLRPRGSTT